MVVHPLVLLMLTLLYNKVNCNCPNGITVDGIDSGTERLILDIHNKYRKMVANGQVPNQPKAKNMQDLVWDKQLAAEAKKIADTCVYAHVRVNDGRFAVGQNLALQASSQPSNNFDWNWAVTAWFDEYKKYTYSNQFSKATGHYTQLVWANTKYVGCSSTIYKGNEGLPYTKLYVCNYGPAGNYIGQYPYKI